MSGAGESSSSVLLPEAGEDGEEDEDADSDEDEGEDHAELAVEEAAHFLSFSYFFRSRGCKSK